MQVWPAIDLRGGKCVRLRQGDFDRETVFGDDPVAIARRWVREGALRLHLVDLDGARDGSPANRDAVAQIVAAAGVPCQLGGGVRDETTIRQLLDIGVQRLVIGTRALTEPDWFRAVCGQFPGRLVLGLDARDGRVASDGWLRDSAVLATELARQMSDLPIAAIVYTDIAKDGMMAGPNLAANQELAASTAVPVIASGGVTTADDVAELARRGLAGCIVGRALYEGRLPLRDALRAAGEPFDKLTTKE